MIAFTGQRTMEILAALISGEKTAMEIIAAVAAGTGGKVKIPISQIYIMLQRMEKGGLIKGRHESDDLAERGGRPRRKYRILASGRTVLDGIDGIRELAVTGA